jgi:hypothetical protein
MDKSDEYAIGPLDSLSPACPSIKDVADRVRRIIRST